MENKLEELIQQILTIVDTCSDDEMFINELQLTINNNKLGENISIKLARSKDEIMMAISKSKKCGTYVYNIRKDNDNNRLRDK